MLRIHFTRKDLAGLSVAEDFDPMWELVLSLHRLRGREVDVDLAPWRDQACRALHPPQHRPMVERLLRLVPMRGYFPDFLTPPSGLTGLDAGIDDLVRTSKRRLRTDLVKLAGAEGLPSWAGDLANGSVSQLTALGTAMRGYHGIVVAGQLDAGRAALHADVRARRTALCQGGPEALLASYGPRFRWKAPVLEVPYPMDKDLHLDGRGLVLLPSHFCRRTPVSYADAELRPVLVYPLVASRREPPQPLVALLGRTRAGVLQAAQNPCTTSELARGLGISAASASEHATVLRKAGLVASERCANSVLHSLTSVGELLLRG